MHAWNRIRTIALVVILNFTGIIANHAQQIDAEARKQEARLQRTVTISEARIALHPGTASVPKE